MTGRTIANIIVPPKGLLWGDERSLRQPASGPNNKVGAGAQVQGLLIKSIARQKRPGRKLVLVAAKMAESLAQGGVGVVGFKSLYRPFAKIPQGEEEVRQLLRAGPKAYPPRNAFLTPKAHCLLVAKEAGPVIVVR